MIPLSEQVYRPSEVAARLGISPPGLRRIVRIYEDLYGELPRDDRLGRLWSNEAVERLEAARSLVQAGRAASIETALQAVQEGLDPSEALTKVQPQGSLHDPLQALAHEVKALREVYESKIERLEQENRELRDQVHALPTPQETTLSDHNARLTLLERRNTYLEGELKRRGAAPQPRRRWAFWSRG